MSAPSGPTRCSAQDWVKICSRVHYHWNDCAFRPHLSHFCCVYCNRNIFYRTGCSPFLRNCVHMCSQLCMVPFIRLGYGSWMIFIRWKDTFEARLTHSHMHFISEWCKQKVPLIKFSVSHLSTFQNCVLLYLYHPKTLAGIKYLFEVNIWSLFVRSNQMHLNILATLQRLKKTCLKRQFILSLVYKLWRLESNISDALQNQTAVGLPATQERKKHSLMTFALHCHGWTDGSLWLRERSPPSPRSLSLFPWNLIWALLRVFTPTAGEELLLNTWPRLVPDQRKCADPARPPGSQMSVWSRWRGMRVTYCTTYRV